MKNIAVCAEKKQNGTSKIVRQSNHDGGRVPDELSEYADRPLYILIALWCCRQKSWVGRKQISAAFAITERRASFQISYILRKTAIILSQTRKTKAEGSRHRCHEIFIEHVFLLPEKQEKSHRIDLAYHCRERENTDQSEMRWLLSRRCTGKL